MLGTTRPDCSPSGTYLFADVQPEAPIRPVVPGRHRRSQPCLSCWRDCRVCCPPTRPQPGATCTPGLDSLQLPRPSATTRCRRDKRYSGAAGRPLLNHSTVRAMPASKPTAALHPCPSSLPGSRTAPSRGAPGVPAAQRFSQRKPLRAKFAANSQAISCCCGGGPSRVRRFLILFPAGCGGFCHLSPGGRVRRTAALSAGPSRGAAGFRLAFVRRGAARWPSQGEAGPWPAQILLDLDL